MLRLAPTPSGFLHFGNACNFALNARWARSRGEALLLRIDDLDRGRYRRKYVEDILRVVELLGIEITDGPSSVDDFERNWSQETRLPLYEAALARLSTHAAVYACPCSRRQIKLYGHLPACQLGEVAFTAPGVAWRINLTGATGSTPFLDIPDATGTEPHRVSLISQLDDFVLRRRDGRPSYQLACTVDDLHFGISAIGRGVDLLPSTASQLLLSDLLGYPPLTERAAFIHHPLLTGSDGRKISKSAGDKQRSTLDTQDLRARAFAVADSWLAGYSPSS